VGVGGGNPAPSAFPLLRANWALKELKSNAAAIRFLAKSLEFKGNLILF